MKVVHNQLMAKLFTYKTGISVTPVELINYARECMEVEMEYERVNSANGVQKMYHHLLKCCTDILLNSVIRMFI